MWARTRLHRSLAQTCTNAGVHMWVRTKEAPNARASRSVAGMSFVLRVRSFLGGIQGEPACIPGH